MEQHYPALASYPLPVGSGLCASEEYAPRIHVDSAALSVMTDLRQHAPVTVQERTPLDEAQALMIGRAIRLLFVMDPQQNLVGLVTANDILGERPLQFLHNEGKKHIDILVKDVMTPRSQLDCLQLRDVAHARVGHIISTMKRYGRQHALVLADDNPQICGLFSTSHIARRLGINLDFVKIARTFSEIQQRFVHQD